MPDLISDPQEVCAVIIPESKAGELVGDNGYNRSGFIWDYQIKSSNYKESYEDLTSRMEDRGMDKDSLINMHSSMNRTEGFFLQSGFFPLDLLP